MSIDGTYDTDNIFAKILRGEMPCVKVFEDDHVLAFMDIFPQSDGHTLVLPKTSARNLLDLDDEALSATMIRVKRLTAAVRLALNPDGIVITQSRDGKTNRWAAMAAGRRIWMCCRRRPTKSERLLTDFRHADTTSSSTPRIRPAL